MWRRILLLLVSLAIATGFGAPADAMAEPAMPAQGVLQNAAQAAVHCPDRGMHHDASKGLVSCSCCNACGPALAQPASLTVAFRPVVYASVFLILPARTPPGAIHSPDPFPPRPARIG